MDMQKIGVIGGDRRLLDAAVRLAGLGYECAVYGADPGLPLPEPLTRAAALEDALRGAFTVLAPIPLSRDGVTLNLPDCTRPLTVRDFVLALSPHQSLYAGSVDPNTASMLDACGIVYADLCEIPEYAYANAYATAEGTLGLLIQHMGLLLRDAEIAIFGGGRIAKFLAPMLTNRGARVQIYARSADQRAWFRAQGCGASNFLPPDRPFADALVNTVPAYLPLEPGQLLQKDGLLLELCGIPRTEDGFRLLRAPSLPGRFCSRSMGKILANTLLSRIGRDGTKEM